MYASKTNENWSIVLGKFLFYFNATFKLTWYFFFILLSDASMHTDHIIKVASANDDDIKQKTYS